VNILSINIGKVLTVPAERGHVRTGIFKRPVDGPVHVSENGLQGDEQADLKHHGGEDKSVYCYPYEHYTTWANEENRNDFAIPQFGENLTTTGITEDDVHIGDRFQIGATLVIEVTQPRQPCAKLGVRMKDPTFVRRFHNALRPGFYARVKTPGAIEKDDPIARLQADPHAISIVDAYRLRFFETDDTDRLNRILKIDALSPSWRQAYEQIAQKSGR